MAHLASIRDIGKEREPIPATVCSPGCHLVKDAEVSVATPPDYRAASPLRLRDSTLHQYFYDLCCKVTINFLLNLDQVMVVRHSLMMPCCTIKVSQRTVVIVFYSPSVPLTINHSRRGCIPLRDTVHKVSNISWSIIRSSGELYLVLTRGSRIGECQFNLLSHKARPCEILMVIAGHPEDQ